jgi:maltose O-acetyltransferase
VIWGGKTTEARGLELHDHVRLYDGCRLVIDRMSAESGIVLGERVALNFGCYIEGSGGVHLGARSILGPHVVIVSSSHRVDPSMPVQQSGKAFGAVHVGEDVWIGAGVIIRLGITIGDRAVVGAGSVVTHDVPAGATVVGNPARILRTSDG